MGRPIVATRVGGLPEAVAHEESGLLVEGENSAALGHAIASILSHPQVAERMGRNARARAQTLFSWDRHVDAYDALYHHVSRSRGHAS